MSNWEPTSELRFRPVYNVTRDHNSWHTVATVEKILQQKWRKFDFPKDQIEWRDVPTTDNSQEVK